MIFFPSHILTFFLPHEIPQCVLCSKNKIKTLPEGVPGATHVNLTLFHISSNELPSLPSSICECPSLTTIYANANKIDKLPINFSRIKSLTSCNLSNNLITTLSSEFVERFGEPANTDGKCIKVSNVVLEYYIFHSMSFLADILELLLFIGPGLLHSIRTKSSCKK